MIDTKPFVDKAEAESGQAVLAQGEARLRSEHQLGETGLLCAVEDGLVFVEEDVLDPGEVTRIHTAEVRVARIEQGFLDATLIVDTGDLVFHFEAMKEEHAAEILETAALPQRLTDTGQGDQGVTAAYDEPDEPEFEYVDMAAVAGAPPDQSAALAPPAAPRASADFFGDPARPGAAPVPPPAAAAGTPATARVMVGIILAVVLSVGLWLFNTQSIDAPEATPPHVTIHVVHEGAPVRQVEVYLDGSKVCSASPCAFATRPGTYAVHAETADGRIGKMTLEVEPRSSQVVNLPVVKPVTQTPTEGDANAASLRLLSPQPGVHVYIDGIHKGELPLVIPLLEPGTMVLRFEQAGTGRVLTKKVVLKPGHAHTVNVELPDEAGPDAGTPAPPAEPGETGTGMLNLSSIPPSTVIVDGRQVGRTPLTGVAVPPGTHIVVFTHESRGRKTRSVTVQAGQTVNVVTRFPQAAPLPPGPVTGTHPGEKAPPPDPGGATDSDYP